MSSLRDKTLNGVFWSLLQNVGGQGIMFMVLLILARLLSPSAFGLVGMLTIFIQVSQALVNAGFNQALIQKEKPDEEDYSSVFFINLFISVALYAVLYFAAPAIAIFYGQPELIDLTRVLALVFVVNGFSYVQETKLTKAMEFKKLMIINLPSTVMGGGVSLVMAVMGYGVWSIVALQLVTKIIYATQIWFFSKWRPTLTFNFGRVKSLFSFGSKLMISSVLETVYQNIYLVVLGRFFPLASVGYYQNASNLVKIPSGTLSGAISKVAFPAFSSIQHDSIGLKVGYRKIIQQLLFWISPVFILAGVLAEPLFRFVFTEKWLPAVPYFQWLCVVGILFPLNAFNLNIVNVKGRSDIFLKLEVVKKIIITIGVIVAIPFGIKALLIFQAFNSIFSYFLNAYFSGRFIQYTVVEQLKDVLPILLLSGTVGMGIYMLDSVLVGLPDLLRIIIGFGTGGLLYWLIARYRQLPPYKEVEYILKTQVNKYLS